jgi:hypothetical protein
MRRSVVFGSAGLAFGLIPLSASAQLSTVQHAVLPSYRIACTNIQFTEEQADREEEHQRLRDIALKRMDATLRSSVLATGAPYARVIQVPLSGAPTGESKPTLVPALDMQVCVTVPDQALLGTVGDRVELFIVPAGERVAAVACIPALGKECLEQVRSHLAKVFPEQSRASILSWRWRLAPTNAVDNSSANLVAALVDSNVRPIEYQPSAVRQGDIPVDVPTKTLRPIRSSISGYALGSSYELPRYVVVSVTIPNDLP